MANTTAAAQVAELKGKIAQMQKVHDAKATSPAVKKTLGHALEKAKAALRDLEKPAVAAPKTATPKVKEAYTRIEHAKKETATKKAKSVLAEIKSLLKNNKEVKAAYKNTPMENIIRDAVRAAQKPGKRMSDAGNVYYEHRSNRSDVTDRKFPLLAKGGTLPEKIQLKKVVVGPTSEESLNFKADLYIDGKHVAVVSNDGQGGMNNIMAVAPYKENKRLIDEAADYARGLPAVEVDPLGDGSGTITLPMDLDFMIDILANKEAHKQGKGRYESGGHLAKTLHVPSKDIESISLRVNKELLTLIGDDVVGGVDIKNQKPGTHPLEWFKEVPGFLSPEDSYKPNQDEITQKRVDKLRNAGFADDIIRAIFWGYQALQPDMKADGEIIGYISGLAAYESLYVDKLIDVIISNKKEGFFVAGLKYPETDNWKALFKKFKISTKAVEVIIPEYYGGTKKEADSQYAVWAGPGILVSKNLGRKKYKSDEKTLDYGEFSDITTAEFKGNYASVIARSVDKLNAFLKELFGDSDAYVKNMSYLYNDLGGLDTYDLKNVHLTFETGGMVNHGFKSGDKIVEIYKGFGIVESNNIIDVVNPEMGRRYMFRVDFPRIGEKLPVTVSLKDQAAYAKKYIDYMVSANHGIHLTNQDKINEGTYFTRPRFEDGGDLSDEIAEDVVEKAIDEGTPMTIELNKRSPAHFGSGKNIDVFGYQTQHFDNCAQAVKEFENAMLHIENVAEQGDALYIKITSSLRDCAERVDDLLGLEQRAVDEVSVDAGSMAQLAADLQLIGIYNYRSGSRIDPDFITRHVQEIAGRMVMPEPFDDTDAIDEHELKEMAATAEAGEDNQEGAEEAEPFHLDENAPEVPEQYMEPEEATETETEPELEEEQANEGPQSGSEESAEEELGQPAETEEQTPEEIENAVS